MQPGLVVLAAGLGRRFGGLKQLAPVGPNGEAILDYTGRDALSLGFSPIVLVVREEIRAELRDHLARSWPSGAPVEMADQRLDESLGRAGASPSEDPAGRDKPLGTAQAVLSARRFLKGSFAVVNADDLYGRGALSMLYRHLCRHRPLEHALVSFRLGDTLGGPGPVTRALCAADEDGFLSGLSESSVRRTKSGALVARPVTAREDQDHPLGEDDPVSMNLWGFRPGIFGLLEQELGGFLRSGGAGEGRELLLPSVIGRRIGDRALGRVRVLRADGRCVGITHPGDLERLRADLAAMVGSGEYPDPLWDHG